MIVRSEIQRGFSLIELMVAMTVSLILLGGVIQIFVSNKQSYRVVDGYSRLQENGRYAVDVLSRYIRLAGYRSNVSQNRATAFPAPSVEPFSGETFTAGQVVFGQDGTSEQPDSITFRYYGDTNGLIGDCWSDLDSNELRVWVKFSIDIDNELGCSRIWRGIRTTDRPLVDHVENMQIVYGVDGNGDLIADEYKNASDVSSSTEWNRVVSVRIAMLLSTPGNVSNEMDNKAYDLNGESVSPANDYRRRHRFVTTIHLRNVTS